MVAKTCGRCGRWLGNHCYQDLPAWAMKFIRFPIQSSWCDDDDQQAENCEYFVAREEDNRDSKTSAKD